MGTLAGPCVAPLHVGCRRPLSMMLCVCVCVARLTSSGYCPCGAPLLPSPCRVQTLDERVGVDGPLHPAAEFFFCFGACALCSRCFFLSPLFLDDLSDSGELSIALSGLFIIIIIIRLGAFYNWQLITETMAQFCETSTNSR